MEKIGYCPPQPVERGQREAIPPQVAVSNVVFYLGLQDILRDTAKQYATWRSQRGIPTTTIFEDPGIVQWRAQTALEDLYYAQNDSETLLRFQGDWGDEYYAFQSFLSQRSGDIAETTERAKKVEPNRRNVVLLAARAAKRISSDLTYNQQVRLFNLAGYPGEEAIDVVKRIGLSTKLSAVGTGVAVLLSGTAAGFSHELLENLPFNDSKVLLPIAYVLNYLSLGLKVNQNVRLLRERDVKNSPDVGATCTHLLLQKLLPDDEQTQNWGARIPGIIPTVAAEVLVWAPAALVNPAATTARNLVGIGFNTTHSLGAELWLRVGRKAA